LQNILYFFFDFLLVQFSLLLLLNFHFFIGWTLDISNFESYSSDLDDIPLGEAMPLDLFASIVAVLDHLPEHTLWILE
jgi:hypothetical protein